MLKESFEVHNTLNPKIWDTATNRLLPEVRNKVIEIVSAFEEYVDVPICICDIQLVGSNASFNYTETSDLDVHIIADFDAISDNTEILHALYNTKKAQFNKNYDVKIRGVEIEMGILDVSSGIVSNGIYSVCDNDWIKEPKPIKSITKHNIEKELEKWKTKINACIANNDYDEINDALCTLRLIRRNSIAVDGEYGAGNQLFKEIRSLGLLQQLRDARITAQSKKLSLEQLEEFYSQGQIINRFLD